MQRVKTKTEQKKLCTKLRKNKLESRDRTKRSKTFRGIAPKYGAHSQRE